MLSFEIIESGQAIQVYLDKEGLKILLENLEDLKKFGHVHLLTSANGGHELDELTPHGKRAIGEIIITDFGE